MVLHIISRILFSLTTCHVLTSSTWQVGMKRGYLSCSAIACEITSADEAEYSGTFRPALERDGTRPCARVRILPFHPRCRHRSSPRAAKSFAGRIFPFGKIRLCSHLYPATTSQMLADDGNYPLPCSPPQLRRCWRGGVRTFLPRCNVGGDRSM